eukprot:CAMPEP_0202114420 /NCGR_PEP_ID=MMETSP0965-20130614/36239_1 /ASSEMBLY_ACC=CAM_ASM_000507 /TAXON_ID=4773 /ORGANISM="Schizochytrium aggregatum, Strain ATCC28209" /LENGTH=52 /DNA_ID=CAMNT_0048684119 /DNA_START=84 /DNA_END=242 /DNA_ORIENTATION=+
MDMLAQISESSPSHSGRSRTVTLSLTSAAGAAASEVWPLFEVLFSAMDGKLP